MTTTNETKRDDGRVDARVAQVCAFGLVCVGLLVGHVGGRALERARIESMLSDDLRDGWQLRRAPDGTIYLWRSQDDGHGWQARPWGIER